MGVRPSSLLGYKAALAPAVAALAPCPAAPGDPRGEVFRLHAVARSGTVVAGDTWQLRLVASPDAGQEIDALLQAGSARSH